MYMYLISIYLVLMGFWVFVSSRKHILSSLLSLEFMVLGIFLSFFLCLVSVHYFYSLIYLTFSACEGALGLGMLVMMGRTHGGDYFKNFSLMN